MVGIHKNCKADNRTFRLQGRKDNANSRFPETIRLTFSLLVFPEQYYSFTLGYNQLA